MKSAAVIALLVSLVVLSTVCEARSLNDALKKTMIEGLQAGPAKIVPSQKKCAYYCKYTKGCIAYSFNINPDIYQCRVFKCINELQPNVDWVSEIFKYVKC